MQMLKNATGLLQAYAWIRSEAMETAVYIRPKLAGMVCTDLRRAISSAWSRVILWA
jgi:hypothetical protein